MEAIADDRSHLGQHPEVDFDVDLDLNVDHGDDFDFDIGADNDAVDAGGLATSVHNATPADEHQTVDQVNVYEGQADGGTKITQDSYEDVGHDHEKDDAGVPAEGFDASIQGDDFDDHWHDHEHHVGNTTGEGDEINYERSTAEHFDFDINTHEELGHTTEAADSGTSGEFPDGEGDHGKEDGPAGAGGLEGIHPGDFTLLEESDPNEDIPQSTTVSALDSKLLEDGHGMHPVAPGGDDSLPTALEDDALGDTLTDSGSHHAEFDDAADVDAEQNQDGIDSFVAPPDVKVTYQDVDYALFADTPDDDPNDFFLTDVDALHHSLSQFLTSLRHVIDDDLGPSDELVVKVDGLGLEFGETTTADFLEQTTFGQILDIHDQLAKLDNVDTSDYVHIYLSTRPNCISRWTDLTTGANQGKSLSELAMYYDDGSADDVEVENDDNVSQGDVSFDDQLDKGGGLTVAKTDKDQEAQSPFDSAGATGVNTRLWNPFAIGSNIASSEHRPEAEKEATPAEQAGEVETDNDLGLISPENEDSHQGLETDYVEGHHERYLDEGLHGAGQSENPPMTVGDSSNYGNEHRQVEISLEEEELIDYSEENEDTADDHATKVSAIHEQHELDQAFSSANDAQHALHVLEHTEAEEADDFFDLGHNAETTEAPLGDAHTADGFPSGDLHPADTTRPSPDPTSATVTFDGDDFEHGDDFERGDDAAATYDEADRSDVGGAPTLARSDETPAQPDHDEIDWNHDDDDELADQHPTELSPSSLSAKRTRQEDDDGLGDESLAKRRRT